MPQDLSVLLARPKVTTNLAMSVQEEVSQPQSKDSKTLTSAPLEASLIAMSMDKTGNVQFATKASRLILLVPPAHLCPLHKRSKIVSSTWVPKALVCALSAQTLKFSLAQLYPTATEV